MQRGYWEKEYRNRGKLWRGKSRENEIISTILIPGPTLDNGCGNGKDTPTVENVIGSDFSRNALKLYPHNRKVQCDLRRLPFKDKCFMNVLFLHSLEHFLIGEREDVLKEGRRVLKDGGVMIVRVFTVNDFRFGKGEEIEENTFKRGNGIITHYFTEDFFHTLHFLKIKEKKLINYNIIINSKTYVREELIIILNKY